jgi:integrase
VDLVACTVKVKEVVIDAKADGGRRLRRQAAPKTSAGFRTVPLSPKALAALLAMIELWDPAVTESPIADGMHPEELVFRLPGAGTVRKYKGVERTAEGVLSRHCFRRYWIPAIKAAGIARMVVDPESGRKEWWPRVHDYRHALASRLHAAGLPEKDVQLVLGQERGARVTWLYTHGSEGALEAARSAISTGRVLRAVQESA